MPRSASVPLRTRDARFRAAPKSRSPHSGPSSSRDFVEHCNARSVPLQVLGLDPVTSRCFWNWRFVESPGCPRTHDVSRLADVAFPLSLSERDLRHIVDVIRTGLADSGTPGG